MDHQYRDSVEVHDPVGVKTVVNGPAGAVPSCAWRVCVIVTASVSPIFSVPFLLRGAARLLVYRCRQKAGSRSNNEPDEIERDQPRNRGNTYVEGTRIELYEHDRLLGRNMQPSPHKSLT